MVSGALLAGGLGVLPASAATVDIVDPSGDDTPDITGVSVTNDRTVTLSLRITDTAVDPPWIAVWEIDLDDDGAYDHWVGLGDGLLQSGITLGTQMGSSTCPGATSDQDMGLYTVEVPAACIDVEGRAIRVRAAFATRFNLRGIPEGDTTAWTEPVAFGAATGPDPTDVCVDSPDEFADDAGFLYEESINCLFRYDLVEGYNDTEFRPNVLLLRQHAATMLVNFVEQSMGMELVAGASGFTDIAGNTHEENINKGFTSDIINGYDDGTFRPGQNVTREQFVSLLVQASEGLISGIPGSQDVLLPDATDTFTDDDGSVHERNIEKAHDHGILEGIPVQGSAFLTQANVTRGEAAHMIANVVRRVLGPVGLLP